MNGNRGLTLHGRHWVWGARTLPKHVPPALQDAPPLLQVHDISPVEAGGKVGPLGGAHGPSPNLSQPLA
jgi:hypothetical protein